MDSFHQVRDTERYKRYKRTEQILREAGMYNITMQTQELEKKNALLQLEIEQFNRDVSAFVQDVLKNPQNKWLRDKILQKCQTGNYQHQSGARTFQGVGGGCSTRFSEERLLKRSSLFGLVSAEKKTQLGNSVLRHPGSPPGKTPHA